MVRVLPLAGAVDSPKLFVDACEIGDDSIDNIRIRVTTTPLQYLSQSTDPSPERPKKKKAGYGLWDECVRLNPTVRDTDWHGP